MDFSDNISEVCSERLIKSAYEKRIPVGGTFELLPVCNMRCRMCYIQHTPKWEELQPVDFWVNLMEQAIAEGMLFPLLTGGEVLLYPGFFDLYERICRMPVYLTINTNATLLDRDKVKQLAKNPPLKLNISLYGASNETYANLCGNPKGFTQVTQAFELLREFGIPFKVNGVMVPENIHDYRGIQDVCNHFRVKLSMSNYMFPAYRKESGTVATEERFTPQEMAKTSLQYMRDHFFDGDEAYKKQVLLYCAAMEHPEIYSLYNNDTVPCKGGICSFWVDWHGCVSGCGMHDQGKIDLHGTSFRDAWAKVVSFTNDVRMSADCKTCRYRCICQVCPAANFCETGSLSGTPKYLCQFCEEYGKLLFEERSRLLKDAGTY